MIDIIMRRIQQKSCNNGERIYNTSDNAHADVIVEVLDARDPLGTRSLEAENAVLAAGKKLIILLNKIDLIPRDALRQWLDYFRKWYTTMPFKANTQEKSSRLGNVRGKIPINNNISSKEGLGVDGLKVLLGNIRRHNGGNLVVGVVGLPNTGKSAVINTLVCRKVATSGCVPGLTRECQVYKIDNNFKIIDSPGVVLSKSIDQCELVLRNCTKPENIECPEPAVNSILSWCPKRQIMIRYAISEYASTADFLFKLAQRMGKLRKGGVPDVTSAARVLLNDWISGKLAHYTLPPESSAPIAEPIKPSIIALEDADLPLIEFDEAIFKKLPRAKTDNDFCPVAIVNSSEPFSADLEAGWTSVSGILVSDEEETDLADTTTDDEEVVDNEEFESAESEDDESFEAMEMN
nr:GTP binding domain protein [Hymenolepis microstoma]